MAQNTPQQQLHDILVSKNFEPNSLDAQGRPAASAEDADVVSFDYQADSGKDYGTVVVMFDNNNNMEIYFGDNVGKGMETEDKKGWFDFLYQLRQFAKRNLMTFGLKNLNRLKYSMAQQAQAKLKESIFESWAGTATRSWNGAPTEARLMIKHKRVIGENDARFRYIESLFVETAEGERFKLPFTKLSGGRAMVEHIRQGGRPYDARGQHITTIVEELNLLSQFKRANQGRVFEGTAATIVETAVNHYRTLQHSLKSLSTTAGYTRYFESWDASAITDSDMIIEDLRSLFVEQKIDTRIEQALPLLARLQNQETAMKEVNVFEGWVNLIAEGTWSLPDTPEKQQKLVSLLSKELPVGPDATNATEQLYDLLGDDELFDQLGDLARENADADARTIILNRLEQMSSNPAVAQVIGQLKVGADGGEEIKEGMPRVFHNGQWVDPRTLPHGLKRESEEQLDELNKDTLKSYVKKASSDRAMRNFDQGFSMGTTADRREPDFGSPENDRKDTNRLKGIHKAVNRLEESGMSEADILLQEIARGNVDIFDIYSAPKSNIEEFISKQLHKKAQEVAREQGYNLDEDIEDILQRIQRELEVEYGVDDNMEIDMDETVGGGNWLEETDAAGALSNEDELKEGTALQGQYGHSGKMSAVKAQDTDMMDRIKFLAGVLKR